MKKVVTIKDIAERLNLSRNTVAKALNGQYVPEKTRELVLNAAREMNYKCMNLSRAEAGRKRHRILLISGKPLNNINYFIPIIKSIENSCDENIHELFKYTYNASKTPFKGVADYVNELKADGIVAIECFDKDFISKLLNLGKPVCFNDFSALPIQNENAYDVISANDEQAVCNAVIAMHKKYKITRFCFVGDRRHCLSFNERYSGMLKGVAAVNGAHTKSDDILCSDASFDYGNPEALKTEILKLRYKPECYVCCNDFVARSVCSALKSLGTEVPKDALVTGFDNVAEAVALAPAVTTFSVEKDFLGRETLRTLVHRIENPNIPSRTITVSTALILRESTDRIIF